MIPLTVKPSPMADTRTCDFKHVTKEQLLANSKQHIADVRAALGFFVARIYEAETAHDADKLTDIEGFHRDFVHGFAEPEYTGWWRTHRMLNRHHLTMPDGTPPDVNLIDVLDYIADCVMAGMARSGEVTPLTLSPEVLQRAFLNTVTLLKDHVIVDTSE